MNGEVVTLDKLIKNLITKEVARLLHAHLTDDNVDKNQFSIKYHLNSHIIIVSRISVASEKMMKA